ncbi:NAD(P)/FAD-dependent oxidoreductase [Peribacillus cavernae]|uniref:NAD(P)/FAD-dependent oxidoreductase n=1 Tax=Peribacillus cavernae TaxID=1674310 RepID=A0A433HIN8_9BACI|nr:NAD(P)/FAD-dependent oxidoreductase [Peribacillus cavernae]MDQ0217798.1 thioredoxin reductase [Peribacillus cavernae]RUQ28250.1 NAD(P)/FAD-dependent oxidoreductase [Peribacillus cavernae]
MDKKDSIIIGGGIAGLQASIQLGRYNHNVLVVDSNQGRSTICKCFHNILGWPNGISGEELRRLGKLHAEKYGVAFENDKVINLEKRDEIFVLKTEKNAEYKSKTIFLATGLVDNLPDIDNLYQCLGKSIYVCPDCDGYETTAKKTVVLGTGNAGANMAVTLTYWSDDIVFVNHDQSTIDHKASDALEEHNIQVINEPVTKILLDEDENLTGILLGSGTIVEAERGFTGFRGNKMNYELAEQAGVTLNEKKHVLVNPRTKETNVEGIWAGGDLIAHSEQTTIAMGDGSQAAIWIHKRLMGEGPPEEE